MFVENLIIIIRYCSCCPDGEEFYRINAKTKDDFIKLLSSYEPRRVRKHWLSKDVISDEVFSECKTLSIPMFEQKQTIIKNKNKISSEIDKLKRDQKDTPYSCKNGYTLTFDQVVENGCYKQRIGVGIFSLENLFTEQEELYRELFKLESDESNKEKVYESDLFPDED